MNSCLRYRIATWNLERPKQNGWVKNQRRLNKIHEINADAWVLTETNTAIDLQGDFTSLASSTCEWHDPGEGLSGI
jgi:hypothetical protein